jgi:hypothetical protein
MNNYSSTRFRSGKHFDTLFTHNLKNQTIMSAAIADVDGDGKNDIIVTTNEGMYVIGTPLEKTIDIIGLKNAGEYQTDWCFGDTLNLSWCNIIQGNSPVNILFQQTGFLDSTDILDTNLTPDSLFVLQENFPNLQDTVIFQLIVDNFLAGKEGKIIVQSSTNPDKNADTTNLLRFHKPFIETALGTIDTIYSGALFTISGNANCTDSVKLFYKFEEIDEWILIGFSEIDSTNSFELTTQIPCLGIFDCENNKMDSVVFGKLEYSRYNSVDSSVFPITILPAILPITIDPCEYACASRTIHWEIFQDSLMLQDSNFINYATMNILMSIDSGKTFEFLGSTPVNSGFFVWNPPINDTNAVIVRLCCDELCYKVDTTISNYQPKYIKTVAPNPLKIPYEAEILYQVVEDSEVTINIIDQANRSVKEIIKDEKRKGGFSYCERWDGRLDDKTPVANGMYYVLLEFSNGVKEIYPIYIRN